MIRVQSEPFDTAAETAALSLGEGQAGAVAIFVGHVRQDGDMTAMTLEHYPGMTEKALARLAQTAAERWPLLDLRIVHRFGRLAVGEAIVYVGASSPHRHAALDAVGFLMDKLKTEAPFWKRIHRPSGEEWVEARSADDAAAARWLESAAQ